MSRLLAIIFVLASTSPAISLDLGNQAPPKQKDDRTYHSPGGVRQGGDDIAGAVLITMPGTWTGNTCGYNNDYDESCPYLDSTAPEVVYRTTPATNVNATIDLCYSLYDTKLYVYDAALNLIACADDSWFEAPCFVYSSFLTVDLQAGTEYYIVIDGWGSDCGEYQMDITIANPCEIVCPPDAQYEGESPLVADYVDLHNGGCNTPPESPLQPITRPVFCGTSGWYSFQGNDFRDTDWLTVAIPASGSLELVGDAEYPTYVFELGPQDCGAVAVVQAMTIGPCVEGAMTIIGAPGSLAWIWVGPTTFNGPTNDYTYSLNLNIEPEPQDSACLDPEWETGTLLAPPPSPRFGSAMAPEDGRTVLIMFGGNSGNSALGDTWEWQGDRWAQRFPPTSPSARFDHAMAYDRLRDRIVLFGGALAGGGYGGDTWEWDGTSWIQVAASGPSPRAGHAMAYDEVLHEVVLYGGWDGAAKGDTWAWNGGNWSLVASTGPSPRAYAAAASDPLRKAVVLFGGRTSSNPATGLDETWEWDGAAWTQVLPPANPPARSRHVLTFNGGCGEVLMTAGDLVGIANPTDTWKWNGSRWQADHGGLFLTSPAISYDLVSSRVIAFGGTQLRDGIPVARNLTWSLCCECDDEAAVLDSLGAVVFPATLDPNEAIVYTDVNDSLGTVDQLFPGFATDSDTWYENWPCRPAIGGEIPDEATFAAVDDSLAALGINVPSQDISDSLAVWENQILAWAQTQSPMPPTPTGPIPPLPTPTPYCPPMGGNYVFGGRDIVFIHGLKLEHVFDRIAGVPDAQVDWIPPTVFPGNIENPSFYTGYYHNIAFQSWSDHIQRFLVSRNIRNRYVIVSYPCNARFDVGIHAILTQIGDAMRSGVGVVDLTGQNNFSSFGTPSFVIVSHSTGGPITNAALWAAQNYPALGAGFIADRCKAHVALSGAFGGSRFASAAVALSPVLNLAGASVAWLCPLFNLALDGMGYAPVTCPPNFVGTVANSVLVDLSPQVMHWLWASRIASTNIPTVLANGGHPSFLWPLKTIFHPGLDDGVLCQNSVGGNPANPIAWPQGFITTGPLGLLQTYDLGLRQTAPKRANRIFTDQVLDRYLQPLTAPLPYYVAATEILYLSPVGMLQSVGSRLSPPFDPLSRRNQYLTFMASTADHFGIRKPDDYPDYKRTRNDFLYERNWEETRTILPTDLADYRQHFTPGPPYFAGDDQALLEPGCTPQVVYNMKGRSVGFKIRIFGRTFEKRWWIWKRHYFRPINSSGKHICDYVYGSILNCGNGIPQCDVSTSIGDLPTTVVFSGASPNPFNAQTTITFSLPAGARTSLRIYDVSGRLVRTLVDEVRPAGTNSVNWDGVDDAGRGVASGTYFARLSVDGQTAVRTLAVVK